MEADHRKRENSDALNCRSFQAKIGVLPAWPAAVRAACVTPAASAASRPPSLQGDRDLLKVTGVFRLAVMMYVRYPLSLRNVEDLLHERRIDITHEMVRFRWNRFGVMLRFLKMRTGGSRSEVCGSSPCCTAPFATRKAPSPADRVSHRGPAGQGSSHRRSHRVAPALCGLINAG